MLNPDKITIKKASGQSDVFDPQKLKHSLLRSGASAEQIQTIIGKIEDRLYPGITTKKIYQAAFKLLRRESRPVAARYKLKSAIMELGPSGFPFEKYVAAILQQQGYQTQTGVLVQGKCVLHEVDVIAQKDEHHLMIECKYHNQPGTVCNVKIPLYIQSRFKDVEASWVKLPGHEMRLHRGWVVTNTKFTTDAIQYGTCAGLHLLGWNYPQKNSLNEQIERLGLYPITCLTTLSTKEKQILLNSKIVLCREVCDGPALLKQAGVSELRIQKVLEEAQQLCQKKFGDGTHS
ncbi:MAG TPA: restriction endonuclease [Flavisolibacter sp.]|nr:restriction endonuclease [Flavisolibacter sp.]